MTTEAARLMLALPTENNDARKQNIGRKSECQNDSVINLDALK